MTNNKLIQKYRMERLDHSNLTDLENLHAAVYGKRPAANHFSRKYNTAYTGAAYIGFIAYNGDLPISYYGVIPCFIKDDTRLILSAQSADTMTHPEYRNRGLFVELAKLTYELCRDAGIQLIFGFPNQNSLHGFVNKLDWQMTETMDCFIIPTNTSARRRLWRKASILKKSYSRHQQTELKKYLSLSGQGVANSVFGDGYAGIHRDYDYLNHKGYNSARLIKTGRSAIWVKINNELLIGDITVMTEDFDALMLKLKEIANKLGIKEIHFHACKETTLHKLFAQRFNAISSFPVIFKKLGEVIQTDRIKFTAADIDTF